MFYKYSVVTVVGAKENHEVRKEQRVPVVSSSVNS